MSGSVYFNAAFWLHSFATFYAISINTSSWQWFDFTGQWPAINFLKYDVRELSCLIETLISVRSFKQHEKNTVTCVLGDPDRNTPLDQWEVAKWEDNPHTSATRPQQWNAVFKAAIVEHILERSKVTSDWAASQFGAILHTFPKESHAIDWKQRKTQQCKLWVKRVLVKVCGFEKN